VVQEAARRREKDRATNPKREVTPWA